MKPLASLSLDLDNQWSYMKTHGDAGWESFPSYLDLLVPRVLEMLRRRQLTITFFIVGQDAALTKNAEALRSIAAGGHEIANHSFKHEPWLQRYTPREIDEEIAMAEAAIEGATGARPFGFRGPGFSLSPSVLETLARRGYLYDCSTLPTFIGPLARAYYFRKARLDKTALRDRGALFGNFSDGFAPNKPYRWNTAHGELVEIPVTTVPGFRTPFHLSYLLYLESYSRGLALAYLNFALKMCRLTGTGPSILLHPLDFLGCDDLSTLAFFPGMSMPRERKLSLVEDAFDRLAAEFSLVPMRTHAQSVPSLCRIRTLQPEAC
jgi:peptidoglycan-N-acetylglucosamine deacetylase